MIDDGVLLTQVEDIGGVGAQVASRCKPTDAFIAHLRVPLQPQPAIDLAAKVLKSLGVLSPRDPAVTHPIVVGTVDTGALNFNTAFVYAEVLKASSTHSILTITAIAPELLIKQDTAEKAAGKVVNGVRAALRSGVPVGSVAAPAIRSRNSTSARPAMGAAGGYTPVHTPATGLSAQEKARIEEEERYRAQVRSRYPGGGSRDSVPSSTTFRVRSGSATTRLREDIDNGMWWLGKIVGVLFLLALAFMFYALFGH